MNDTSGKKDAIPEEFSSDEEAGKFWNTHDSTEYLEDMEPVEAEVCLETRHFEIEVDADVVHALRERARTEHVPAATLANDLLRKQLAVH